MGQKQEFKWKWEGAGRWHNGKSGQARPYTGEKKLL